MQHRGFFCVCSFGFVSWCNIGLGSACIALVGYGFIIIPVYIYASPVGRYAILGRSYKLGKLTFVALCFDLDGSSSTSDLGQSHAFDNGLGSAWIHLGMPVISICCRRIIDRKRGTRLRFQGSWDEKTTHMGARRGRSSRSS